MADFQTDVRLVQVSLCSWRELENQSCAARTIFVPHGYDVTKETEMTAKNDLKHWGSQQMIYDHESSEEKLT